MRKTFFRSVVLLAVFCAACGHDRNEKKSSANPVAPPVVSNDDTTVVVRGGGDARIITTAFVVVGGQRFDVDAGGSITISGHAGQEAAITVPGHLAPRTIRLVPGSVDVTAWYLPSGTVSEDVRCLVYKVWNGEETFPLTRLPPGATVYVVPEGDATNEKFALAFEFGLADGNRLGSEAGISFRLSDGSDVPGGAIVFRAYVDAKDPNVAGARAVTYRDRNGNYISGGRIVFASLAYINQEVIAHELGHAFGFWHSCRSEDLMAGSALGKRFSAREIGIGREMYNRPVGNLWIDSEPRLSAATLSRQLPKTSIVVD